MAVYTHFEVANPPSSSWDSVFGSSYVANASALTIINSDGTLTKALGSFVLFNGILLSGVISTLQRTSGDGMTLHENITGLSLSAITFVTTPAGDRFALALAGEDTLNGNSTDEDLFGGNQNDTIYGNGGDDHLYGEAGADLMVGGPGTDGYYVDDPGDVVSEAPDEGDDVVITTLANYTLPANVNRLSFEGAGSHTGYGNELNNILSGNDGVDTLHGLDGNDTFHGGGAADTFYGGKGDDMFSVAAGDVVIELPGEGIDTINTFLANYTLPANVENLGLNGDPGVFFGNELDNKITVSSVPGGHVIYGLGGNDFLYSAGGSHSLDGGSGNDKLTGFSGTDTLTGGSGDDTFIILTGNHTITDFIAGAGTEDRIELANYKPGQPNFGQNLFVTISDVLAHATQNGADTVIDLGAGHSVTLKGVQKAALDTNDFVNIGGPGADVFVGTTGINGHDTFHGEAGDDTMVFAGSLDKYTLKDLGSKITVSGPDGNDTLYGIELLQFTDGTIHVNDGNPLFDTLHYMSHNLDVFHAGIGALDHYNAVGWHEGRDPNAWFDTSGYLAVNKDVAASGMNPLDHYHQAGWQQGRDPGANFDTTLYLINNPDVAAAGIDPLAHYLANGMAEGRKSYAAVGPVSNGFDAQYYLFHNPDVAAAGIDPHFHFNVVGWQEGRDPNGWFDTSGYLAHYGDVAAAGINPFDHYRAVGWQEGRDASSAFDTLGYLAAYPDVAAAGMNPLDHFLQFGIYEGRQAVNDGMWG